MQDRKPSQLNWTKEKVTLYMMRHASTSAQIAGELMHWSNKSFDPENYKGHPLYPYRIADQLIEIFREDRFIIYHCEICADMSVFSDLTDEEKLFFDDPNEPDIEDLALSTEQICADCQAARSL